jgi:hypothetical protein
MGQRRWFDVVVTLVFVTVATLEAQAPHSNGGGRPPAKSPLSWLAPYREPAARLIGEAVGSTFAWQRLALLTDSVGNRLSGSPALDRAIQWAIEEMKRDGLENVHTERVLVPKWVRGTESAEIIEPAPHSLVMLGLGDSVGTPPEGIQAEVLTIHGFDELDARSGQVAGRIVFYNVPFTSYGDTVRSAPKDCGRRTPARCSTRATRRKFPPPPSAPKMRTASSECRIAAAASSSA